MYIYKIYNDVNDKVYIGLTKQELNERLKQHFKNKNNLDTKFYRAIKKYGKEKFHIEIVEKVNDEKILSEREIFWINEFDSIKNGYNTATGGIGGDTLTNNPNIELIRKKISDKLKGYNNGNSTKIKAFNVKTNELIHFKCVKDCQEYLDINAHAIITRRCRKVTLSPYKNTWMFYYENEIIEGQETIEIVEKFL